MTPERWRQITDVFHAARGHDAAARAAFLDEACAGDPPLRAEVDAMLAAEGDTAAFGEMAEVAVAEERPRLEPGAMVGSYRVEALISVGGMGEVYRARDQRLGRDVAIKVLSEPSLLDPARRRRLEHEARLLAALNHPRIAAIYELEEVEGSPALVLELVEGPTLADRLAEGPLPIREALLLARQIAEAVQAAHEKGIVHRDLKPANIKLARDGTVKVLDFGVAKVASPIPGSGHTPSVSLERTREGTILGTPGYMSPEQARGQPVDRRTDVWAFGCVLYEMLTGHRAFQGATLSDTIAAILGRDPDWRALPRRTPLGMRRLLRRCLQKDPDQRQPDLAAAQAVIDDCLTGRPTPDRILGLLLEWASWKRGILGTVAALALVIGLVGFWRFKPASSSADKVGLGPAGPSPGRVMMAVLPFENLSGDAEQEYFSDGLTEEIIAQLARLHPERLGLIARTSVMRYKKTTKGVGEIARELGVDYVVEGSVRREADRVRITAQLIDGRDQSHRWAETYDRDLAGILVLQSDVARGISQSLRIEILPAARAQLARARPVNPAAYDPYLRGWALVESFHGAERPERLADARKHFERALESDPNFALALAGLSLVEVYTYFFNVERTPDHMERAERLARRALALDPQVSEAHVALGDVHGAREEWDQAIAAYREGLRLDPHNAYGWEELAWALFHRRHPTDAQEAERAAREAIRLQPGWFWAHFQLGRALRLQSRHAEAVEEQRYALQLNPGFQDAHVELGEVHLARGEFRRALAEFAQAPNEEGPALLTRIAAAHAGLGDHDRALSSLENALGRGYRGFDYLDSSPHFARLREDPRFQDLVQRHRR